jgi:antirestriction protein
MTSPRIYVACLAAYNNGTLHGQWIDVTTEEEMQDKINVMLKASPCPNAEEWEIHDHEGLSSWGELHDLETCVERAEFIAEHGDIGEELISECSGDLEHAKNLMDNYCGEFDSEVAFAEQTFDELYAHEMPKHLAFYFDYEAFARDLFLDGYRSVYLNGVYHVFSDC